jgi:GNAT superfamily N-acetyltransferase
LSFYIEKLNGNHQLSSFDCGEKPLNDFLQGYALQNQKAGSAQTYVALEDQEVIGFYSLTVGEVQHEDSPERIKKGLARYPIPIVLLARLAVDQRFTRRGIGKGLLKDALRRIANAADIIGIRAVLVHAKNETAHNFYKYHGFTPSPTNPYRLFLLIKDIRQILHTGS